MGNDLQVSWTDEQWARVNQVIQEEASRARVAASFLPLIGPLPADTDFVRSEAIWYPQKVPPPPTQKLAIRDRDTIQLATLQVMVSVRGAQMADPEMASVLAMFRRAANVLARLEDSLVFRGLIQSPAGLTPPVSPPQIWEILGGQLSDGLLAPLGFLPVPVPPGPDLVQAVSDAIGQLESQGHFGPFAVVLDQKFFLSVQTPTGTLVLPQDRVIPFLGGGPLLRSSTLPDNSGVVVALGGRPVELVVATDVCLQFLQVTAEPLYVFRVCEKLALRIKEANAIATLTLSTPPAPAVWSVSPNYGPVVGGTPVNIRGINFTNLTQVRFGDATGAYVSLPIPNVSDTLITVASPSSPLPAGGAGDVYIQVAVLMNISGAVAGTGGVVRLTVNNTAQTSTNDTVIVSDVTGTTEANGIWQMTLIDATHIELQGSVFAHAYTSGGTAADVWPPTPSSANLFTYV
jgi:uncharacterized linocin/CFP29 family protein